VALGLLVVEAIDEGRDPAIPDPALECGDVDAPEVLANKCQGSLEVDGVVQQVRYDASAVGSIEHGFALLPLPPIAPEYFFLFSFPRAIVRICFGKSNVECAFIIQLAPMHPDEFTRFTDRTKTLVVKIVDRSEATEPIGVAVELSSMSVLDFAESNFKSICLNVFGVKGSGDLTEVLDEHGSIGETGFRPMGD